jgi:hypothetical protein
MFVTIKIVVGGNLQTTQAAISVIFLITHRSISGFCGSPATL